MKNFARMGIPQKKLSFVEKRSFGELFLLLLVFFAQRESFLPSGNSFSPSENSFSHSRSKFARTHRVTHTRFAPKELNASKRALLKNGTPRDLCQP